MNFSLQENFNTNDAIDDTDVMVAATNYSETTGAFDCVEDNFQGEYYGVDDYYLQEDACCIYLEEDAYYDPDPGDIYVG